MKQAIPPTCRRSVVPPGGRRLALECSSRSGVLVSMLARHILAAALSGGAPLPATRLLPLRRVCASSSEAPQPETMAPKRGKASTAKASGGVAKKKAAKPAAAPPAAAVAVSATDIAIEACKS